MEFSEKPMRVIGRRKEQPITFSASGESLAEGARFNDEMHKLPSGATTCIPKGVFRFKTHQEANEHWLACVSNAVAQTTMARM